MKQKNIMRFIINKMDYQKRELLKLLKAYNNLYNVFNGFYSHSFKDINLLKMIQDLENQFKNQGYELIPKKNTYGLRLIKK